MKPDKINSVLYRFTATFFVFVAVCAYLSHDAASWIHEHSHHKSNEHNHESHHNCDSAHQVVKYDKCEPESCDHEAHFSPENTPCFWCNLPPSSVHAEQLITKSSFFVLAPKSAVENYNPTILKGLHYKNRNRGPPYNIS